MSAYYCLRCNNHRDTFDCPPGEIYGELACEFCTDDFETALEEYTAAAEVLDRTCQNCNHWDTAHMHENWGFCAKVGVNALAPINIDSPAEFGCNRFEAKQ